MGINKRFAEARAKLSQESGAKPGVLDDILPRINQGIVIPIVSNSFRVEQIFRLFKKDYAAKETFRFFK